jgi:hypothetical protein
VHDCSSATGASIVEFTGAVDTASLTMAYDHAANPINASSSISQEDR